MVRRFSFYNLEQLNDLQKTFAPPALPGAFGASQQAFDARDDASVADRE